jgi:hypothetical protein
MGRDYRSVVFKHQALLDIEASSLLQLCIAFSTSTSSLASRTRDITIVMSCL